VPNRGTSANAETIRSYGDRVPVVSRCPTVVAQFTILGPVDVTVDGRTVRIARAQRRALLALLLLHADRTVSVTELIEALWGGAAPATAKAQIQAAVSTLRRVLGAVTDGDLITTSAGGYRINVGHHQLDLALFNAGIERARRHMARHELPQAAQTLRSALDLWRGTPLLGVNAAYVESARAALQDQRLAAYEQLADVELAAQHHERVVADLTPLAALHPQRERMVGQLMLALHGSGHQAEALALYRRTRQALVDQLGVDPTPDLQALHKRILDNDVDPAGPATGKQITAGRPRRFLPRGAPDFTGRGTELAQLDAFAQEQQLASGMLVISAIAGIGGVGKTALALHWAHRAAWRFPDGQLYVNLRGYGQRGPVQPAEALGQLLRTLGLPPERIPTDVDEAAAVYRARLADSRTLILLDNAASADQVRPLLPGGSGNLVLVTSRDRLGGLIAYDGARRLTLDTLTPPESLQLLCQMLGAERVAAEREAAENLAAACGHLPLALRIAAANLADRSGDSIAAYAAELRSGDRLGLLAVDGDPHRTVAAVFGHSYRTLSATEQGFFQLLGLIPFADFTLPVAAALAGVPEGTASALLNRLLDACLVAEHASGRFAMHDLIREYAALKPHNPAELTSACLRLLDFYLHTAFAAARLQYPQRDPIAIASAHPGVVPERLADRDAALNWFTAEHHNLMAAIELADRLRIDSHVGHIAWCIAVFLDRRGYWQDWVDTQQLALAAARRRRDLRAEAIAHRSLGVAYTQLARHDQAETHMREALGIYTRLKDRTGQAHAHFNLGISAGHQCRHREALRHRQRALELYRAVGHQSGQADALNAIAWELAQLGDYHRALAACNEAVDLLAELGDQRGEASARDTHGFIHTSLGDYEQAEASYKGAIQLYRATGDQPAEAATWERLGNCHETAGEASQAANAWAQAVDLLRTTDSPEADRLQAKLTTSSARNTAERSS
jgi:DNA-binding SARP family transcriptional activator